MLDVTHSLAISNGDGAGGGAGGILRTGKLRWSLRKWGFGP